MLLIVHIEFFWAVWVNFISFRVLYKQHSLGYKGKEATFQYSISPNYCIRNAPTVWEAISWHNICSLQYAYNIVPHLTPFY